MAFAGVASHPPLKGLAKSLVPAVPFTSLSKSISGSLDPPLVEKAFLAPNDMKSSLSVFDPWVPDSSCNFLVCSTSTLDDRLFIKSMKAWNCFKSSSGPKLILHRTGRISMATKSASAIVPTWRRTLSAAIATAGSLVFIALMSGTIFSCIVYLSRAVEELVFLVFAMIPSRPSLLPAGSFEPPQSITNASRPRTLIPRLLVFVNTEAMTGKSSFFIVEKSSTGKIAGRLRNEASTMLCVGDSIAKCIMGSISFHVS